jgi:hypothetical protein
VGQREVGAMSRYGSCILQWIQSNYRVHTNRKKRKRNFHYQIYLVEMHEMENIKKVFKSNKWERTAINTLVNILPHSSLTFFSFYPLMTMDTA